MTVIKGEARITGPGRVVVDGRTLETDRIIVATGSDATIPSIDGLQEAGYWTNREATTLKDLPESIVILGGGPVGVELGQFFCRFGVKVTLVQGADRLINREDPAVGALILDVLRGEGVDVRLNTRAERVRSTTANVSSRSATARKSGRRKCSSLPGALLASTVSVWEAVGIDADRKGIAIDEHCRAADGVWAVGDVTGVMPFTHVGMYQSRIAAADIAGRPTSADYTAIPRVVFSDPEIAAVGLTEEQARAQGFDVITSHTRLPDAIARPWTYEKDPRGDLGLIADRQRQILVGAWAVAPLGGEWIHQTALAIKAQIPLEVLKDTVAQFPIFSEALLKGVEALDA